MVKFRKDEIAWTMKSMDSFRQQLREKWERNKAVSESKIDDQGRMQSFGPKQTGFVRSQHGMTVSAIINGKLNVRLILDTGASLVVLKKSLASELGIESTDINSDIKIILADGRQSGAKHIILNSIKVEDLEVENVDAAILIDDTQEELSADGLLGMSFLKHFNFKIDQKENKLILERL